jgi:hypothetical protein
MSYGHVWSGRFTTIGVEVLLTTTQRKGSESDGIDLHVRQESRHMDEIAGFRARNAFTPRAPADFADARQDIGNRLLLSMMMDARTGSRLDLEQPAPQRRLDAELRRYRGQAHGARRLCRSWVKSGRADNANWGIFRHHVHDSLLVGNDRRPQLEALSPLMLAGTRPAIRWVICVDRRKPTRQNMRAGKHWYDVAGLKGRPADDSPNSCTLRRANAHLASAAGNPIQAIPAIKATKAADTSEPIPPSSTSR